MTPEEIRKIIGQNIVSLRREYGISRKALAKLINVPVNRLKRVEEGDVHAKLYDFHIKRLSRVFGITADAIFEDSAP